MGTCILTSRKSIEDGDGDEVDDFKPVNTTDILVMQRSMERSQKIPLAIKVAHFTPSSFPMVPIVNKRTSAVCLSS